MISKEKVFWNIYNAYCSISYGQSENGNTGFICGSFLVFLSVEDTFAWIYLVLNKTSHAII